VFQYHGKTPYRLVGGFFFVSFCFLGNRLGIGTIGTIGLTLTIEIGSPVMNSS